MSWWLEALIALGVVFAAVYVVALRRHGGIHAHDAAQALAVVLMAWLPLVIEADREHREHHEYHDEIARRRRERQRDERAELARDRRERPDFYREFYDEPDSAPETYYEPGKRWMLRVLLGLGGFFAVLSLLAWIGGAF